MSESGLSAFLVLRHGPTEWMEQGLLQGRTDVSLSLSGREVLAGYQIPESFQGAELYASPLSRASETAELLFKRPPQLDERLIERHFGEWEGQHAKKFEEPDPQAPDWGWPGLDHRPPGGESLLEVRERASAFFLEKAQKPGRYVVVTHKGVLLALVSWLTGWPVRGKPPFRVKTGHALEFSVSREGRIAVLSPNRLLRP